MLSRATAIGLRQPTRPLETGSGVMPGDASGRVLLRRLRNLERYALGGLLAPLDCRLLVASRGSAEGQHDQRPTVAGLVRRPRVRARSSSKASSPAPSSMIAA